MYYFSPASNAFYHSTVHLEMPEDAIALTDEQHKTLLEGMNNGKSIEVSGTTLNLVDKPILDKTWKDIRNARNNLLKKSDYTQLLDYPGNKEEWAAYRQLLRDIPQTFDDPNKIVWPADPNT